MRVRWTTDAAQDLERICDYIAADRPDTARRIAKSILQAILELSKFPNQGRLGRVPGTRELVFPSLPFVAIYEVSEDVRILRILHGAQKWPAQ